MTEPHRDAVRELPMLAGIARFFHWWEELLNIVSGPVLLFGLAIALIDLLTDGKLTATSDALLFAWAISQALGIDVQLMGSSARARDAHGWRRVGWLVLLVPLSYAAWQAGDVFAVQQSQHISEAAALAQLGISVTIWLGWRAALAVGLVILNGFTRYRAPAPVETNYASEADRLRGELELAPLRARLREQQLLGLRGAATAFVSGVDTLPAPSMPPEPLPEPDPEPDPEPPVRETATPSPVSPEPPTPPTPPTQPRPRRSRGASGPKGNVTPISRRAKRDDADVERAVRAAWSTERFTPGKKRMSNTTLQRRAGVSPATASTWGRILHMEDVHAAEAMSRADALP